MHIARISKHEASCFFKQYEHLGNCGLGVWHYGCFEGEVLQSVVSFGTLSFDPHRSSIGEIAKRYNLRVIQLTRGGTRFDAPLNTPSKSIKMALQQVQIAFGISIIVAYSDTKWNEIGTIYQASNFLYLGVTNPKGQANYRVNGRVVSGWNIRKKFGTRDMSILESEVDSIEKIPLSPKHIYIYVNANKSIRKAVAKELNSKCKPYPKRIELSVGSMHEIWLARERDEVLESSGVN